MSTNMHITSLSWIPHRPCLLLRWPTTSILLDCALDLGSLANFMPFAYTTSDRIARCPRMAEWPCVRSLFDRFYVDGVPEVHPVPLCSVAMDTIDVIAVSNWQSLLALPFYTEGTGFRGRVYATEPTLQFGRLMIEEMLEYFERIVASPAGSAWKESGIWQQFPNTPTRSPLEWRPFYDEATMTRALDRVRIIAFKETVVVDGPITISAYGSAYAIGSTNWLVSTENDKIAYLSATALRTGHTKPVDWSCLKNAETLLATSLSPCFDNSPETSVQALIRAVKETVSGGGNVILPIAPCGTTYDLLTIVAGNVDAANDVPIYFISPVARKSLAFSNVYGEWLADANMDRVYTPEEPFRHHKLVESKRVRVYDSLYGDFSRELRTPCIVFAGHPSLRIGDAPHLLEMWGGDPRNAVFLTDPDYEPGEAFGPWEELPIRRQFFPVDCRVDYGQLPHVLEDLKPKVLIVPEQYARPQAGHPKAVVEYNPLTPIRHEETISISCKSRKRRIRVHPDLVSQLAPRGFASNADAGLCSLKGVLSAYDNRLELLPSPRTRPLLTGKLTPEAVARSLQRAGIAFTQDTLDGGDTAFTIAKMNAVVTLHADGTHTNIRASRDHRVKLGEVVASTLVPI